MSETIETTAAEVPAMIEPTVIEKSLAFRWNYAEIKAELQARLEKYVGLVVTEDNLQDMEKTHREIAGLRGRVDKFRLETKKALADPANQFDGEVKELLDLIRQAETPIRDQILKYEANRVTRTIEELGLFFSHTAESMGLRPEYTYQVPLKLANRTTSAKAAREEIVKAVDDLLKRQAADDAAAAERAKRDAEAAETAKQRDALLQVNCETISELYSLKTPISAADIRPLISADTPADKIAAIVRQTAEARKLIENTAAAEVKSGPPVAPIPGPPVVSIPGPPTAQPVQAPAPTPEPARVYNVRILLSRVTLAQATAMRAEMTRLGIAYEVINQYEVMDNGQ